MVPTARLEIIARNLMILSHATASARTMGEVINIVQALEAAKQVLNGIAYNIQKKQIQAMQFDLDPNETGLRKAS